MNTSNPTGESPMQAAHRKRIEAIRDEAIQVAGTAAKIAAAMTQVLERGGAVSVQPQLAFLTGAHARMAKDVGVLEFLQGQGIVQKKPPQK